MKRIRTLNFNYLLLLVFCFSVEKSAAQMQVINDQAKIQVDTGVTVHLSGHLTNRQNSFIAFNGKLNLLGNFTDSGYFYQDTGTVNLIGTLTQQLRADSSKFYWLQLNNTAGANFLSGVPRIKHTLQLTAGTLQTNDSLTFLSDSLLTARVDEIQSGANLSGDIIMERYVPDGTAGFHQLGSAVSGAQFQQWFDDFTLYGMIGALYPSSASNVYYYTESDTGNKDIYGYHAPLNITDGLVTGQGYFAYIDTVPTTIDIQGPAHTFAQNLPVTYTNNVDNIHDGWNMVCNPYPSDIIWTAAGWTKTNIDNAIYVFDVNNGVYASYVSGISTNGGSPYICSSQAFWVKANAAGPVLTLTESVKTPQNTSFFKQGANLSAYPQLRMSLQSVSGGMKDETVLSLSELGTVSFDWAYDAYKLEDSRTGAPYLATVLNDSADLSINALPDIVNAGPIPLRVKVNKTGNFNLKIQRIGNINVGNCLYFEDLYNHHITDLKTDTLYTVKLFDTTLAPRFLIHTNPDIDLGPDVLLKPGDSITLTAGPGYFNHYWSTGETAPSITVGDSGTYVLEVDNAFGCVGRDEIKVRLDSAYTEIAEEYNLSGFQLFPIPANHELTVKFEGTKGHYQFRFYSADGKLVWQEAYNHEGGLLVKKWLTGQWASGMYTFMISSPSAASSHAVVISH